MILGVVCVGFLSIPVFAQESSNHIPSWIKVVAGAWYNNEIDDTTFSEAMSFLIENNIIEIRNPIYMALPEESEMIVNLNKQIQTLQNLNDQLEQEKDDLEENLTKENTELQQGYETEILKLRKNWGNISQEKDILQMKYDLVKVELDTLKQN